MSRMTTAEIVRKGDIALSDLSSGGLLTPDQSDSFFRKLIDQPTILNEARTVIMRDPKREINKVGFGTRILRPGIPTTYSGSRALDAANRAKPDLGRVTLDTVEVVAEVRLPYEVLEDQIEHERFSDTIMELITERAALDLEELILQGDTGSSDAYLALLNGVLKQQSSNVVNAGGATLTKTAFKNAVKAMPDKYLRNRAAMRFYVSVDNETQYRDTLADRQTAMGDSMISGLSPVYAYGTPVAPVALMPSVNGIFLDPKNIIVGFHREVMVETDKIIQERVWLIVLTARVDVKIEEEEATVKIQNLG